MKVVPSLPVDTRADIFPCHQRWQQRPHPLPPDPRVNSLTSIIKPPGLIVVHRCFESAVYPPCVILISVEFDIIHLLLVRHIVLNNVDTSMTVALNGNDYYGPAEAGSLALSRQ
jgi:hypothetical protein